MLSTSLLDCLFSLFLVDKFYNRPVKKSASTAKTKQDLSAVRPIENLANRGPTWDQAAAAETKQKQKSEKFGENSQQEIFSSATFGRVSKKIKRHRASKLLRKFRPSM